MPTTKKRINLTVDDSLANDLDIIHTETGESLSSIVIQLMKEALELREDQYFNRIAEERDGEGEVSHEEIWD